MKLFATLFASALVAISAGVASADTLTLASYGSTASAPTGVDNTATVFTGGYLGFVIPFSGGPSYNIGTGGVWAAPTGTSSWVSNNPQNFPGGSSVEPTGSYIYQTTFVDDNPLDSTGVIYVMADDTTGVYLNGTQITAPASPATTGTCDSSQPNCTSVGVYTLKGFVSGVNTLSFDVLQEHGSAEGLDFSGSVNVTPEPGSLLLLGSGLMSMGGLVYRRRRTA